MSERSIVAVLKSAINEKIGLAKGTERAIAEKLSLWLSESNAKEIMDQIYTIEILMLETGIDFEKCGCSQRVKQRIWGQLERNKEQ